MFVRYQGGGRRSLDTKSRHGLLKMTFVTKVINLYYW